MNLWEFNNFFYFRFKFIWDVPFTNWILNVSVLSMSSTIFRSMALTEKREKSTSWIFFLCLWERDRERNKRWKIVNLIENDETANLKKKIIIFSWFSVINDFSLEFFFFNFRFHLIFDEDIKLINVKCVICVFTTKKKINSLWFLWWIAVQKKKTKEKIVNNISNKQQHKNCNRIGSQIGETKTRWKKNITNSAEIIQMYQNELNSEQKHIQHCYEK